MKPSSTKGFFYIWRPKPRQITGENKLLTKFEHLNGLTFLAITLVAIIAKHKTSPLRMLLCPALFRCKVVSWIHVGVDDSGFSQTHKIGNIGIIANFVFPEIRGFLLYLQYLLLVNIKLDIIGCKRIKFEYYILDYSCSFLMAQLKQSWQYWHSCTAESLWKPLLDCQKGDHCK